MEITKQLSKAKLWSLYEKGRVKIIKRRKKKMLKIKKLLYNSHKKRIAMRFVEIFIVAGLITMLKSPELSSLLPPVYIAILAAIVKAMREISDRTKFEGEHTEIPNLEDIKEDVKAETIK